MYLLNFIRHTEAVFVVPKQGFVRAEVEVVDVKEFLMNSFSSKKFTSRSDLVHFLKTLAYMFVTTVHFLSISSIPFVQVEFW